MGNRFLSKVMRYFLSVILACSVFAFSGCSNSVEPTANEEELSVNSLDNNDLHKYFSFIIPYEYASQSGKGIASLDLEYAVRGYTPKTGEHITLWYYPSHGCTDLNCTDDGHFHFCTRGCRDDVHDH